MAISVGGKFEDAGSFWVSWVTSPVRWFCKAVVLYPWPSYKILSLFCAVTLSFIETTQGTKDLFWLKVFKVLFCHGREDVTDQNDSHHGIQEEEKVLPVLGVLYCPSHSAWPSTHRLTSPSFRSGFLPFAQIPPEVLGYCNSSEAASEDYPWHPPKSKPLERGLISELSEGSSCRLFSNFLCRDLYKEIYSDASSAISQIWAWKEEFPHGYSSQDNPLEIATVRHQHLVFIVSWLVPYK